MQNKEHENAKLVYEKPSLRIIELAAEEVMATGCKTAPGSNGPLNLCLDGGCSTLLAS